MPRRTACALGKPGRGVRRDKAGDENLRIYIEHFGLACESAGMSDAAVPNCAIVVPTKDRQPLLERLLETAHRQLAGAPVPTEIVDDGSAQPVRLAEAEGLRVHRTTGLGPAAARNTGWRAADAEWIVFLDDDVVPEPGWWTAVEAALAAADARGLVAVEGRVVTEPVDSLYERSVERSSGGWGLTCNVLYRREALEAVGGFDVDFPSPHCEDLDLFFRISERGETQFDERMTVRHFKRPFGFKSAWRRGQWGGSEIRLASKHPGVFTTPAWIPLRALPLALSVIDWVGIFRLERRPLAPKRLARLLALAVVQCCASATSGLRRRPRRAV